MTIRVFVYGTLRRHCPSGAHNRYLANAHFIGSGRVKGRLYRVSYYPGLRLETAQEKFTESTENHWVIGEVYALANEQALVQLDDYEECTPPYSREQEYQRATVSVQLDNGDWINALTYVYQQPTEQLEIIPSGDFLKS